MKNQFCIVIGLSFVTMTAFSQEFVATLKEGLDSANLTINDSIHCRVYKAERFITFKHDFDETYWPVWTKTGNFGSLDRKYFDLLSNEKVFKLKTDTARLFNLACGKHATDNFKAYGLDYCELVKSAAGGNERAFLKILTMYEALDGGAAETNPEITWSIFNLWSDSGFNKLLLKQAKPTQILVAEYMVNYGVSYPITDFEYYYAKYYPQTWKTLKYLVEIKKRK